MDRSMRRRVLAAVAGATVAGLVLAELAAGGSGAGAAPRQATGTLQVSPGVGVAGAPLAISGTGCAEGVITVRVDGKTVFPYGAGDVDGNWTVTTVFPPGVGQHDVDADCSDWTTAGAPTTFFGPGDLRFTYDAVTVQTEAQILVDPTVTAPPSTPTTTPPTEPTPAPPAAPTRAAPAYTG
jgi:hypothetical protein